MLKAVVIPEVIESIIGNRFGVYITGSFIIGGATIESDIDIVVPLDNSPCDQELEPIVKRHAGHVGSSAYNNGTKLCIPGCTTINILRLHPLDYAAFMFATDTMRCAPIINDRNARHRCFEELCHAYKSFINPGCVTVSAMYNVANRHDSVGFMAEHIDWGNFYAR